MKNKFKRIGLSLIACLLAFAMLLSFVACDDEEDKKDDETSDEEKEDDKKDDGTPGDDSGDDSGDDLKGDIDVTSAEKVAELINSLLEESIFDKIDSLNNLVTGAGESIKISDLLGITSNINILADNFTVNGVKTDLLDMFVIKDNTLYLCGKDEYGFDNSIAGKLTEDGYAIIAFSDGVGELLDFGSFAELLEVAENAPKIDIDAIKEALTVKTSDLVMKEEGVWELKSSYIVNALKGIVKAIGLEDSEGAELPSFDALLNMTMIADLRELNKNGAVGLELNIPDTINAKVNISKAGFKVAVTLPAAETEVVFDFIISEEENAEKVTGNLVVKYADTEVVNGKLEVVVKEDSVKVDFSLTIAETEITANVSQISKENGDSNLTANLAVKNAGVELLKGNLTVDVKKNTADALSQTTADFSLVSDGLKITADFSSIKAKTGNVETTGNLSVKYDDVEIIKGTLEAFVTETGVNETTSTLDISLIIAETEITAEFAHVENADGNMTLSGNASVKLAGEEIFKASCELSTLNNDDGTINITGDLSVEIVTQDEYGEKETIKLDANVNALIGESFIMVSGSADVADGKLEFNIILDAAGLSGNSGIPFNFSYSIKSFDGVEYVVRNSFCVMISTIDASNGKYKVSISINGTEAAGDITFGGADNFVLPEKEAEFLDSYLKLVEKYPEYNAQLEVYNDMVQSYIDEGKADELPESFYIEDKNNPEVGYFFDLYGWSDGYNYEFEFNSEIDLITEDTTYWYEKYTPAN